MTQVRPQVNLQKEEEGKRERKREREIAKVDKLRERRAEKEEEAAASSTRYKFCVHRYISLLKVKVK